MRSSFSMSAPHLLQNEARRAIFKSLLPGQALNRPSFNASCGDSHGKNMRKHCEWTGISPHYWMLQTPSKLQQVKSYLNRISLVYDRQGQNIYVDIREFVNHGYVWPTSQELWLLGWRLCELQPRPTSHALCDWPNNYVEDFQPYKVRHRMLLFFERDLNS